MLLVPSMGPDPPTTTVRLSGRERNVRSDVGHVTGHSRGSSPRAIRPVSTTCRAAGSGW